MLSIAVLSVSVARGEPPALSWYCSEENLARFEIGELDLPIASPADSDAVAIRTLVEVDRSGARTVRTVGPAGVIAVAADAAVPAVDVVALLGEVAPWTRELIAVLQPDHPPDRVLFEPQIERQILDLCLGGPDRRRAEYRSLQTRCPALKVGQSDPHPTFYLDPQCDRWLTVVEGQASACPAEHDAIVALAASSLASGPSCAPVPTRVAIRLSRDAVVSGLAGSWGERWPDLVAGAAAPPPPEPASAPTDRPTRVFHHSELDPRRQRAPKYPEAALPWNLGEVRCLASVTIDVRGRPESVVAESCPPGFGVLAERAVLKWRWFPARERRHGPNLRAWTTVAVSFAPPES